MRPCTGTAPALLCSKPLSLLLPLVRGATCPGTLRLARSPSPTPAPCSIACSAEAGPCGAGVPPAGSPGVPPGVRDVEFFPGGETPPEPAAGDVRATYLKHAPRL